MENLELELSDFYKGKTVLITGHTGFKGSWLTETLLLFGAKVIGYSIDVPTNPSLFDLLNLKSKIVNIVGDIRNLEYLYKIFVEYQPEIVFHLAAQPLVRLSYLEPVKTYTVNVMGTVNILECLRLTNSVKSFINVTTDKVYRNVEQSKGYVESDILDGYDPYSNSKSCSELVTSTYKRSFFSNRDISISTVRAGNVIGGGDFALDRIIPDCFRAVEEKSILSIRNPDSVRPYQHVLEPISVYLKLAMLQFNNHEFSSSYNVGPIDEDCLTTIDLVTEFQRTVKDKSNFSFNFEVRNNSEFHEAGLLKLNSSYVNSKLMWESTWSIRKGIEETTKWYISYLNKEDLIGFTERQIIDYFKLEN